MPPKARITKEMIIDAGFEVVRQQGAEKMNVRTIAEELKCSTQPVMYYFKTMEEIRRAVYQKADAYHSVYITKIDNKDPMKKIGLLYIRFAVEEKNLFRFLFQSDEFAGKPISELMDAEELMPVFAILKETAGLETEQAKSVFMTLFLCVHGYASLLANNSIVYDEGSISAHMEQIYRGAILERKRK